MIDPATHERASALFLALRALPEAERDRALEEACEGNQALRDEVRSLLAHDLADSAGVDGAEDTPAHIGPYRVIRRIGHGGSGYVMLAEQDEPVRRRVAIKIVPYAAVSADAAARFEFERRALERTEHPNIAKILDTGRTGDGLPYLVMEYVEGETITAYCRARSLPLRMRIALVVDIADAVQHAHQRGVIHRDIKPANILVSEASGRPTPRVLDFGIAKPVLLSETMGDAPVTSGMPVGTPAYMAPEQAGGQQPVDTRADVYALGAVLYELVCGKPPIDTSGDPAAVMRRLREIPPTPPSRVLAQGGRRREIEASARVLADLDRVLAKAMEKSPARRYPTAEAFADDLRLLLRGEPVRARPATVGYRTLRFAQRNRAAVIAGCVVAFALIVGVVGLATGLVEAERQRREATVQRDAQQEINRFLTDDLLAAVSPDREGTDITAVELLRRAGTRVEARLADRPLIAASIHHTLGVAHTQLGALDDAEAHLARALELRREAAGPDSPDTVRTEVAAAGLLGQRQRLDEAEEALRRVLPRARDILGLDDPAYYAVLNDLGVTYDWMDRGEEAVALLEEALAGRTRLLGNHDPLVLVTTSNLAQAYERLGQTDRTLDLMRSALDIALSLDDPPRMTVLGLQNNIGATLQDLGRHEEAAPYIRAAANGAAAALGGDHPATLTISGNLAALEARLGNFEGAVEVYQRILDTRTRLLGPDAHDTMTSRYGLCSAYRLGGKMDEAVSCFESLLTDMRRALGDEHWLTAQTRVSLAVSLRDSGRPAAALPYAREGAAQLRAIYGDDHPRASGAANLVRELTDTPAGEAPPQ